ncbi:MAG: alpha/beta hydrolase, partial [Pseudomonadota bacterium]
LMLRTPDTDAAEMQDKYGDEPSQFVELADGLTVHYRDEGPTNANPDAPAIILLHGSTADLHTWQMWVDALREDYRVVRFDQIGHGLTGPDPNGDYSLESFVSDIDELADALELDRFILGGSSMGGAHTIGYALAHPGRLDGIILVGASGAPIRREGGRSIVLTLAQTPVINQVMAQITPRSMIESSLSKMVTNEDILTDEAIDRYWELLRYPGNRSATITRFGTPRTAFEADQVAALDIPSLIVWGAEDPLIPVASGRWYEEHLPNATYIEYPGIGHLPHEEAAEATIGDLTTWLLNLELANQAP